MKRRGDFDNEPHSNKKSKKIDSSKQDTIKEFLKVLKTDPILEYALVWFSSLLTGHSPLRHCAYSVMMLFNCDEEQIKLLKNVFKREELMNLDSCVGNALICREEDYVYYSKTIPWIDYVSSYTMGPCVEFVNMKLVNPDVVKQLNTFDKLFEDTSVLRWFLTDTAVSRSEFKAMGQKTFDDFVKKNDYVKEFLDSQQIDQKKSIEVKKLYPELQKWYNGQNYKDHYPLTSVYYLREYLESKKYNLTDNTNTMDYYMG